MKIINGKKYFTLEEAMDNTSKSIIDTANEIALELRNNQKEIKSNDLIYV